MKNYLIKALDITTAVVFFISLAASHFDRPPARWFIQQYCALLDTNEYPVMFIAILMTLLVALPFFGLKRY